VKSRSCDHKFISTKTDKTQEQSSKVGNDDYERLKHVLVIAASVSFCCLVLLSVTSLVVTLYLERSSGRQQFTEEDTGRFARRGSRCNVVFLMLKAIYSVTFTFSCAIVACRLVAGKTGMTFAIGADLTTATRGRHLRQLEKLEGTVSDTL